jgi:hypothetical protein
VIFFVVLLALVALLLFSLWLMGVGSTGFFQFITGLATAIYTGIVAFMPFMVLYLFFKEVAR